MFTKSFKCFEIFKKKYYCQYVLHLYYVLEKIKISPLKWLKVKSVTGNLLD